MTIRSPEKCSQLESEPSETTWGRDRTMQKTDACSSNGVISSNRKLAFPIESLMLFLCLQNKETELQSLWCWWNEAKTKSSPFWPNEVLNLFGDISCKERHACPREKNEACLPHLHHSSLLESMEKTKSYCSPCFRILWTAAVPFPHFLSYGIILLF